MRALYRSGRQAEALRAYQDARRTRWSTSWASSRALHCATSSARYSPRTRRWTPRRLRPPGYPRHRRRPRGPSRSGSAATSRPPARSSPCSSATSSGRARWRPSSTPSGSSACLGRFFDAAAEVVVGHGGTIDKFIGDAVMAVFGVPRVHEDDAARALRAALDLRDVLAALNDQLQRDWGVRIAVRTGVNTGEVMTGDLGSGRLVTGDAVVVATSPGAGREGGRNPRGRADSGGDRRRLRVRRAPRGRGEGPQGRRARPPAPARAVLGPSARRAGGREGVRRPARRARLADDHARARRSQRRAAPGRDPRRARRGEDDARRRAARASRRGPRLACWAAAWPTVARPPTSRSPRSCAAGSASTTPRPRRRCSIGSATTASSH